jgi:hypothetical protein
MINVLPVPLNADVDDALRQDFLISYFYFRGPSINFIFNFYLEIEDSALWVLSLDELLDGFRRILSPCY